MSDNFWKATMKLAESVPAKRGLVFSYVSPNPFNPFDFTNAEVTDPKGMDKEELCRAFNDLKNKWESL